MHVNSADEITIRYNDSNHIINEGVGSFLTEIAGFNL